MIRIRSRLPPARRRGQQALFSQRLGPLFHGYISSFVFPRSGDWEFRVGGQGGMAQQKQQSAAAERT